MPVIRFGLRGGQAPILVGLVGHKLQTLHKYIVNQLTSGLDTHCSSVVSVFWVIHAVQSSLLQVRRLGLLSC